MNKLITEEGEEKLADYDRLKLEYARLHENYRRLQAEKDKQLLIQRVSNCFPTKEEFASELENHQNKWSKSHSKITNNAYALGFRHCFHYMSDWIKQHR